jgi:hypothetical protein
MSKEGKSKNTTGALARFEPGGNLGPVEDRNEYDQRLKSLRVAEKELAEERARFRRPLSILRAPEDGRSSGDS